MIHQSIVESVDGLTAMTTTGERLRIAGNLPVYAGKAVWTDGKIVYGNLRISSGFQENHTERFYPVVYWDYNEDCDAIRNGMYYFDRPRSNATFKRAVIHIIDNRVEVLVGKLDAEGWVVNNKDSFAFVDMRDWCTDGSMGVSKNLWYKDLSWRDMSPLNYKNACDANMDAEGNVYVLNAGYVGSNDYPNGKVGLYKNGILINDFGIKSMLQELGGMFIDSDGGAAELLKGGSRSGFCVNAKGEASAEAHASESSDNEGVVLTRNFKSKGHDDILVAGFKDGNPVGLYQTSKEETAEKTVEFPITAKAAITRTYQKGKCEDTYRRKSTTIPISSGYDAYISEYLPYDNADIFDGLPIIDEKGYKIARYQKGSEPVYYLKETYYKDGMEIDDLYFEYEGQRYSNLETWAKLKNGDIRSVGMGVSPDDVVEYMGGKYQERYKESCEETGKEGETYPQEHTNGYTELKGDFFNKKGELAFSRNDFYFPEFCDLISIRKGLFLGNTHDEPVLYLLDTQKKAYKLFCGCFAFHFNEMEKGHVAEYLGGVSKRVTKAAEESWW